MPGPRYVVTGQPGSGKSTWVRQRAAPGDIVWDLDEVASVMGYGGTMPPELKGHLPWPLMKATLKMRDALVQWLATTEIAASVYLIVTNPIEAQRIARHVRGVVQTVGPKSNAVA